MHGLCGQFYLVDDRILAGNGGMEIFMEEINADKLLQGGGWLRQGFGSDSDMLSVRRGINNSGFGGVLVGGSREGSCEKKGIKEEIES